MTDRRRNLFILLVVLGLIIASAVVIATKPTKLGLDLKGGVELVYEAKPTPQQPTVDAEAIDRSLEIMRKRVDRLGVAEPEIQRSGENQIRVGLPDVDNAQRAIDQVGEVAQLYFFDWEPNVIGPNGRPDPTNKNVTEVPLPSLYAAVKRAAERAPQEGNNTTNDQYYLFSKDRRLLAGPEDSVADLVEELPNERRPAGSEVLKVNRGTIVVKADRPDDLPENQPWDRYFVLNDDPALRGTDIEDPKQEFDQGAGGAGQPIVTFQFTDDGRNKWAETTKRIARRGLDQQIPGTRPVDAFQHFAAVLDDEVITRPFIDFTENPNGIDGRTGASIEGGFTIGGAQDLANNLKLGALPVRLELISQSQVSATLGQEALDQGLVAGIAGFLIVAIFLIVFYRVLGVIAVVALVIYALYFLALIKLIPITMTLPGIAGTVLTIGVAADANIVIFERVKEEVRAGNPIPRAITQGYKRGLTAIIDANVVTLMVAFILFILATAGVKGFAFTLGVGTLVSLFTAVLAVSAILGTMSRSKLISRPSALGAAPQKHKRQIDFMGLSRYFFALSGLILVICALALGGKGVNFGIDFESGTRIETGLVRSADEEQVRQVMEGAGFADAKIQRIEGSELGPSAFQISTPTLGPSQVQQVRADLEERFGIRADGFSNQSIGPTFGETVARSALIAIIASLLVISAYIALRFEWKYAVPVLIALMHDILITSGVYALTGREVTTSTVAALLTILGFSLYDTIIVFDRVRENVPRMPRAAFSQIMNRSLSEVLVRSLATSFCTLLPVLALMLFGGETLKDFAFALLVGIASGTYSSMFIATPVLSHWKEREKVYAARTERIKREFGGIVPAYAVATAGAPADVEPERKLSRRAQRRLTTPEEPSEVSQAEFDEMVADLHPDEPRGRTATAEAEPEMEPEPEPGPEPAPRAGEDEPPNGEPADREPADGEPADGEPSGPVSASSSTGGPSRMKPSGKPKQKRPRNRRHGRNR